MANSGKSWSVGDENTMLALLAKTKMSSSDCNTVFAHMFERSPRAIYMRRVQIAQKLLKNGHRISYLCKLLHLSESDILLSD
jgi:hypothetical protein